jgi:O-antigen/teichoic acid export membrane protein
VKRIKELLLSQTIKDTLVSFLGLGFSAAVGLIFTVILARYLGPEQFGIFSAVTALYSIVYSLGDLGIAASLINFIPKLKEKRSELINTSFSFEIFVCAVILIIFVGFSIFHDSIIPGSLGKQILIAGALAINYLLISFIQGIFTAERRFLRYSFTQIIDSGIKIILILILMSVSGLSVETALLANVVSTLIALTITFGKEFFKIKLSLEKGILNKIFHFAKWLAINRVFGVFISRIDVLLLNLLVGSFQAGIFSAANRITLLFSLLVSSLGSVVNPRFSSFGEDKEKISAYIKKLLGLVSLISVFMLILVFLANPIINIVFGDKYLAAIPVFRMMTLAMIVFMFQLVTIPPIIFSFNQPKFVARLTALQVVVLIGMELILIPSLGALAPAIALGAANIIAILFSSIKLHKLLNSKPSGSIL